MAILPVYNAKKEKIAECEISDAILSTEPNPGILYDVVNWQLAKRRSGNASTKRRDEVSGGGKKPWRQKGTGNARAGSNTSPIWRRGGSVFGPKPRDYSYNIPKKVRRLGLRMALASKYKANALMIIRDFGLSAIKTKDMKQVLTQFEADKALIVLDAQDRNVELSARNIPNIKVLLSSALNVYDILKYKYLFLKEGAVEQIHQRLVI
jgi:large subunit ribosomal protein L4